MHTDEYASFSDRVLQAECDSMEKLHMMQEVPYLAEWQQANHASQTPQQQEILRRRQLMLNAQGNSALTAQARSLLATPKQAAIT